MDPTKIVAYYNLTSAEGENWAELAYSAWAEEADAQGVEFELVSEETPPLDPDRGVSIIKSGGKLYQLKSYDEFSAFGISVRAEEFVRPAWNVVVEMTRPGSTAIINRPTRDPGDDYDEVMEFYLNDLVAHGWITGWSPFVGGNILLRGPSAFGGGLTLSYASALDYAAGYFDAMHHAHKISYSARGCGTFPDGPPEYDTDEIIPRGAEAKADELLNGVTERED